jgi:hypothetical protein
MGFYSYFGARIARKRERVLLRILSPHLEPAERVLGWFIAMTPGRIAEKADLGAAVTGIMHIEAGLALQELTSVQGSIAGARPFKGAMVLTDSWLHVVITGSTDKPKAYSHKLPAQQILAAGRLAGHRWVGVYRARQGFVTLVQETLYFDIPADSEAVFTGFCSQIMDTSDGCIGS